MCSWYKLTVVVRCVPMSPAVLSCQSHNRPACVATTAAATAFGFCLTVTQVRPSLPEVNAWICGACPCRMDCLPITHSTASKQLKE